MLHYLEGKDMTNQNAIFTTIGASNHSSGDRQEHDYYATPPSAVEDLLSKEDFNKNIWEPACGGGHISELLKSKGYNVKSTDLIDRGYSGINELSDFLKSNEKDLDTDIITNPPYSKALEFVEKSLSSIKDGCKVAMLLKLTFLEGQKRRKMFDDNPPARIHVYSKRMGCYKNGDFDTYESSAVCYAWFVWEKGNKNLPVIDWI